MKPSILIIYTGGTIGMKPDPTTGALVPFDFSGIFEEFPTLQSLNIGIEVFTMDPVIDSSNVSPRNWLDLAAIIRDNYARYDGFVVLHGTDTMSYTASALSFAPPFPKCRSISRTVCSAPTARPNAVRKT